MTIKLDDMVYLKNDCGCGFCEKVRRTRALGVVRKVDGGTNVCVDFDGTYIEYLPMRDVELVEPTTTLEEIEEDYSVD